MHLIKPCLNSVHRSPLAIFFLKDSCNWLKVASVEAWDFPEQYSFLDKQILKIAATCSLVAFSVSAQRQLCHGKKNSIEIFFPSFTLFLSRQHLQRYRQDHCLQELTHTSHSKILIACWDISRLLYLPGMLSTASQVKRLPCPTVSSTYNEVSLLKNEVASTKLLKAFEESSQNSEILLVSWYWALVTHSPWLGHVFSHWNSIMLKMKSLFLSKEVSPTCTLFFLMMTASYNLDFKAALHIYLPASFIKSQDTQRSRDLPLNVSCRGVSQVAKVVKNPPANAGGIRDRGSFTVLGRFPEGGCGNPL